MPTCALYRSAHALIVLLAVSSLLASACSNTATVTRTDGARIEGHIVGRNATHLFVEQDGETRRLGHADVADIDHPGDGRLVVGVITSGVSLAPIIYGVAALAADDLGYLTSVQYGIGATLLTVGLAGLAGGLYLAIDGGLTWADSRAAAEQDVGNEVLLGLAPWVAPHGQQMAGGAGVVVGF